MSEFAIPRDALEEWSANRKMIVDDVVKGIPTDGDRVLVGSLEDVRALSDKLAVPVSEMLRLCEESDLEEGIKVHRRDEGFTRTEVRGGRDYYTYHHLATTKAVPNLMALRLDLHCRDDRQVVLNEGHDAREIVYVTRGTTRFHWESDGERRELDLDEGDSVYVRPGIRHSFMAVGGDAEIIAVNF